MRFTIGYKDDGLKPPAAFLKCGIALQSASSMEVPCSGTLPGEAVVTNNLAASWSVLKGICV
jgi:hypothetical protein